MIKSSRRIGIIAEDETDCQTGRVLFRRILAEKSSQWKIEARSGRGSGAIHSKGVAWVKDLELVGCTAVVVIHDLDRNPMSKGLNDEIALRRQLERLRGSVSKWLVCIPVEEIEAWFWSDEKVLRSVGTVRAIPSQSPETIVNPKEELRRLSQRSHKRSRYNTKDNSRLAELLDLDLCARRCPSFRELRDFVLGLS